MLLMLHGLMHAYTPQAYYKHCHETETKELIKLVIENPPDIVTKARSLLERGAEPDVWMPSPPAIGQVPLLHHVILSRNQELIQLLLDHGVNTSVKSSFGLNAVELAIRLNKSVRTI